MMNNKKVNNTLYFATKLKFSLEYPQQSK